VNAPHAAGLAGFFDMGGIHQSDSVALGWPAIAMSEVSLDLVWSLD
jgi:hypothetical protein